MNVRIRGIYATALTRLFVEEGFDVVQASDPIRDRFDAEFGAGAHDVAVETTGDRQGVAVEGAPEDARTATALLWDVGIDTFAWDAPIPRGAVFDGVVTETLGSGAVVVLDANGSSGFLPYGNAEEFVDVDDRLRVQVTGSSPPWSSDRPVLATTIRADGGLATLVRGRSGVTVDTRDDAAGRELVGLTDLLGVDVPDGWGIEWRHSAVDADMETLGRALERAVDRAKTLEDAFDTDPSGVDSPHVGARPVATTWVWFGRNSRVALDDARRTVTPTMPGHHRTKATAEAASVGVDLAEALCEPDAEGEFPFDVVTSQLGPTPGDRVSIGHGKPDGRLISLGTGEVVEWDADGTVAVERELSAGGTYDALGTPREAGDTALTKFREGRWWYPTVYRDAEGGRKGIYVNVCTPVECFPDTVRYVDLHVDVVKHPDGTVERVDDDELDAAVERGHVSETLAEKARSVASSLEGAL